MSYTDKRAKELHSKIKNKIAKNMTTIAVGLTEAETIVGTNDVRMNKDVKTALQENEVIAECNKDNHAEEDIIKEADNRNLTVKEIGASRNICSDCENLIKERNILTATPFSGKKSRKRR